MDADKCPTTWPTLLDIIRRAAGRWGAAGASAWAFGLRRPTSAKRWLRAWSPRQPVKCGKRKPEIRDWLARVRGPARVLHGTLLALRNVA